MKISLSFLASLILSTSVFAKGGIVGNGGDTLTCRASTSNAFNGTYTLDYVVAVNERLFNLIDDSSQDDVSREIYAILKSRLPDAAEDYSHFMRAARRQIFSRADFDGIYTWIDQRQGLSEINDEFITHKVPENCLDSNGNMMAYQAVLREERDASTFFNYDFNQLTALKLQSNLQLSMLMTHEWLWYYSANANVVRQVNSYLHSKEFRTHSTAQTLNILTKLGFNLNRPPRIPAPPEVEVEINDCDLSHFVAPTVKAVPNLGVTPIVINHTDCGFSVYSTSYGVPYADKFARTADSNRYGRINFKMDPVKPGFSSLVRLAYYFDATGEPVNRLKTPYVALLNVIEDDSF